MDDDLDRMTAAELLAEVKKLREGIRGHRDGDGAPLHDLVPDRGRDDAVEEWPQFCAGCLPPPAHDARAPHSSSAAMGSITPMRFMRPA